MWFSDEFEHVASNGKTYVVEVEGCKYEEDSGDFIELDKIEMYDELGNPISDDDDVYDELEKEAFERDYELEDHSVDFDYYD